MMNSNISDSRICEDSTEGTSINYPDCSLYEVVANSTKKYPDKTAYIYSGVEFSYTYFLKQIDDVAKSLKKLNIKKGDKVTICMPNTPEAIITFYAINKIGAIANMVHPLSAQNEIKYYLQISKSVAMLIIDYDFDLFKVISAETDVENIIVATLNESISYNSYFYGDKILNKNVMCWKDFVKIGEDIDYETNEFTDASDVAAILYTGGSTGDPKGVILTNGNFNYSTASFLAYSDLDSTDTFLAIMPIFHGFGLRSGIHMAYFLGSTNVLIPRFNAKKFHILLEKYKPSYIAGVPTLWNALLQNEGMDSVDLSFLKLAVSGGDTLPVNMKIKVDEFLKEHGANIKIRPGYGLTECLSGGCIVPEGKYKSESVGIPYPDSIFKIVKPGTSQTLQFGVDGEICISSPSVMLGYLDDPEKTNEVLKVDENGLKWLHTGDLGHMDEEGWIFFKSRIERIIISSGYNIYPQRLENVLVSHPNIREAAVIGIPHPFKMKVPKAFIVLNDNINITDEIKNSIYKHCRENLAKFTIPQEFEYIEELPKNKVNKVDYLELENYHNNRK
ncbi:MAG: class I adenylate-forming enzyme family protein [Methanobacteriaceae archaeon]|nr:class I adenylate-forming enzyme family protein [Methanobacteriaceae archaeon]